MKNKIRKIKNFTLDLNKICTGYLVKNDKMCTIGQYLNRCGYSKHTIEDIEPYNEFERLTGLIPSEIHNINDDSKSSWKRRIVKLKKVFSSVGINLKIKERNNG